MNLPSNMPAQISFSCNICGGQNHALVASFHREVRSCATCGSTPRFRGLMMALSQRLYGDVRSLDGFPQDKRMRGLGMSEWPGYADRLAEKFEFTNSYYHIEPRFDVTSQAALPFDNFEFVICTEVFEHIERPLDRAFSNLYKATKPGGTLIFSAPTLSMTDTIEHFPDLHQYEIVKFKDDWLLVNKDQDDRYRVYEDLVFHGGPGTVLEMRLFCEKDLIRGLSQAGFVDVIVHNEPNFDVGYYWPAVAERMPKYESVALGYVMSAVRPLDGSDTK